MLLHQTLLPFFSFFFWYCTASLFIEGISSSEPDEKREVLLFLFCSSEVNSTWLITFERANQRGEKY